MIEHISKHRGKNKFLNELHHDAADLLIYLGGQRSEEAGTAKACSKAAGLCGTQ